MLKSTRDRFEPGKLQAGKILTRSSGFTLLFFLVVNFDSLTLDNIFLLFMIKDRFFLKKITIDPTKKTGEGFAFIKSYRRVRREPCMSLSLNLMSFHMQQSSINSFGKKFQPNRKKMKILKMKIVPLE